MLIFTKCSTRLFRYIYLPLRLILTRILIWCIHVLSYTLFRLLIEKVFYKHFSETNLQNRMGKAVFWDSIKKILTRMSWNDKVLNLMSAFLKVLLVYVWKTSWTASGLYSTITVLRNRQVCNGPKWSTRPASHSEPSIFMLFVFL